MTRYTIYTCFLAFCTLLFPVSNAAAEDDILINVSRLWLFPSGGQPLLVPNVPQWHMPIDVMDAAGSKNEGLVRTVCLPKEPKAICLDITIKPSVLKTVSDAKKMSAKRCTEASGGGCGGGFTTLFYQIPQSDIAVYDLKTGKSDPQLFPGGSISCDIDFSW